MSWKKKILRLLGTNETRVKWKWRRFKESFGKRGEDEENERRHVKYEHKHCPSCRSLVDRDDKTCHSCGEPLPSMAAVKAEKALGALLPDEKPVTRIMLAVILGIFAVMVLDGINQVGSNGLMQVLLTPPFEVMLRWGAHVRGDFEPWRIIMSNFIHFGLIHLAFNAYALNVAGPEVERYFGSGLAFVLFMVTGVGGMAFSNVIGGPGLVAGASGAIMGFLGLAGIAGHKDGGTRGRMVRDSMFKWAAFVMLIGIAASASGTFAIDNYAHGGGLILGVGIGWFLPLRGPRGWRSLSARRLVSLGVVLSLGIFSYGVYGMVDNQLGNVTAQACVDDLQEDDFEAAVDSCREAVEEQPDALWLYHNYALALFRTQQEEKALALCQQAADHFGESVVMRDSEVCRIFLE